MRASRPAMRTFKDRRRTAVSRVDSAKSLAIISPRVWPVVENRNKRGRYDTIKAILWLAIRLMAWHRVGLEDYSIERKILGDRVARRLPSVLDLGLPGDEDFSTGCDESRNASTASTRAAYRSAAVASVLTIASPGALPYTTGRDLISSGILRGRNWPSLRSPGAGADLQSSHRSRRTISNIVGVVALIVNTTSPSSAG
jgi:hypothetical protein